MMDALPPCAASRWMAEILGIAGQAGQASVENLAYGRAKLWRHRGGGPGAPQNHAGLPVITSNPRVAGELCRNPAIETMRAGGIIWLLSAFWRRRLVRDRLHKERAGKRPP